MLNRLKDFWSLFGRLFPYSTKSGLRRAGNPGRDSPVLVTCNYELTVRMVIETLERDGIDAWLLVAPTGGVNVWCAGGAGRVHRGPGDLGAQNVRGRRACGSSENDPAAARRKRGEHLVAPQADQVERAVRTGRYQRPRRLPRAGQAADRTRTPAGEVRPQGPAGHGHKPRLQCVASLNRADSHRVLLDRRTVVENAAATIRPLGAGDRAGVLAARQGWGAEGPYVGGPRRRRLYRVCGIRVRHQPVGFGGMERVDFVGGRVCGLRHAKLVAALAAGREGTRLRREKHANRSDCRQVHRLSHVRRGVPDPRVWLERSNEEI